MATIEETKRLLRRWGYVDEFCRNKRNELRAYQFEIEDARQLEAFKPSALKSTQIADPTYKKAAKAIKLTAAYSGYISTIAGQIERELAFKALIDNALTALDPSEARLIKLYYGGRKRNWLETSMLTSYSERGAKYTAARAIRKLAENIRVEVFD